MSNQLEEMASGSSGGGLGGLLTGGAIVWSAYVNRNTQLKLQEENEQLQRSLQEKNEQLQRSLQENAIKAQRENLELQLNAQEKNVILQAQEQRKTNLEKFTLEREHAYEMFKLNLENMKDSGFPLIIPPLIYSDLVRDKENGKYPFNILIDNRITDSDMINSMWEAFKEHLKECFPENDGYRWMYNSDAFKRDAATAGLPIRFLMQNSSIVPTMVLSPTVTTEEIKLDMHIWGTARGYKFATLSVPTKILFIDILRKEIYNQFSIRNRMPYPPKDPEFEALWSIFESERQNLVAGCTREDLLSVRFYDSLGINFHDCGSSNSPTKRYCFRELGKKLANVFFAICGSIVDTFFMEEYGKSLQILSYILNKVDWDKKVKENLLLEYAQNLVSSIYSGEILIGIEQLEKIKKDINEAGFGDQEDIINTLNKLTELLRQKEEERKRREEEERRREEYARKHDLSIPGTKAGERKTVTVNGVEFAFRWCPAGTFMMGSPSNESGRYDHEKQHQVTLTKGFWMMETEVTQKQWKAVMGTNPSHFKGDDLPVECVSWEDCDKFCKKCTELGLPVQLPTESQWEYACRAGSTTAYFWGNALNGDKANCEGNYPCGTTTKGKYVGKTTPVASYQPNAWGLYDMHGNVWEWCQDWLGDYPSGSVTDPTGPTGPSNGSFRVFRGGCWRDDARFCRSALRGGYVPGFQSLDLGFRCAKGQ